VRADQRSAAVPDAPPGHRGLSLWLDTIATGGDSLAPRPGLDGDTEVDVCIVGAGFTGLWTAYYLLRAEPSTRVLVLEAEIAGFGASGRNGGWCSALFPTSAAALARRHGREAALALRRAMNDTVVEVGHAAAHELIDCDWVQGGTVVLARTPLQLERARADIAADRELDGVDGLVLLSQRQARERIGARSVLGATFTRHCARVHPGRLVRGLATAVERRGGCIAEQTRVQAVHAPGSEHNPTSTVPAVVTHRGTVRARHVVRATEAWTATLPGWQRDVVPVYSLMIATAPLPSTFWHQVRLSRGETFTDGRHLTVYGQRTADDRLAFGGRGAPYHRGSRIDPAFDRDQRVFALLRDALTDLFPAAGEYPVTHAWGGPLGVPRDWHASVGLDPATGIAWAGGYVGDGVGTSNLAGRTLADLILGQDSDLTRLPWVGHRSPRWEPEPVRWLEVNAALRAMTMADGEERLTGRPSLAARTVARFIGH
jgi:glycine/D-amino acid oxidase-like deaminating enzyme